MKGLLALLLFLVALNPIAVHGSLKHLEEKACLAEVIYRESRGEPRLGQLAVGQVVLNRVKHTLFPDSICEVMFQKGQFPWVKDFKHFSAPEAFHSLADIVLSGKHELHKFKATHFHATYVDPKWNLRKLATIGNHIFYTL